MGYDYFIDERDLYNQELEKIPVYFGCKGIDCSCGKCKEPRRFVDRQRILNFVNNMKSLSDYLCEQVKA